MKKEAKLILFIIICFSVAIFLIIYRYEGLLKALRRETAFYPVTGGAVSDRQYSAKEIWDLIKKTKEYIGDSLTIYDNGEMRSNNGKFQGTIDAVITAKDNMDIVHGTMESNKLPIQYNVYVLAATYYRAQYPEEFKNK